MTIKSTGSLNIQEIANEFGGTAPLSLSAYYRGGARVPNGPAGNANIALSGAISIGSFFGSVRELGLTIAANRTNYNLLTEFTNLYGAPSGAVPVRLTINAGVTLGATAGNTALIIGQFPAGTVITIDNFGSIQGYGGAAGAAGGDAIYANYANQTVVINNKAGGTIYGGGGGGGRGGTGGTGGGGYYTTYSWFANGDWAPSPNESCRPGYLWSCRNYPQNCDPNAVCLGGYSTGTDEGGNTRYACNGCYHQYPNYSSGGAGGAGGAGGVGQGYGQANAVGSGGAGGGAPGTNAGWGGTGGTGGAGGTWGNAGGYGGTGNTGGSGNYTGGSAGAGGSAGGAGGRYLVKGASSVTVNNSGTILGALA